MDCRNSVTFLSEIHINHSTGNPLAIKTKQKPTSVLSCYYFRKGISDYFSSLFSLLQTHKVNCNVLLTTHNSRSFKEKKKSYK